MTGLRKATEGPINVKYERDTWTSGIRTGQSICQAIIAK